MKEEKRDIIMQAALERFVRYGYHKTTVDEIARQARVGKGTIYFYFKNKEDIMQTLVDRELTKGFVAITEATMDEPSFTQRLRKVIRISIEYFHQNDLVSKVMAQDPDVVLSVISDKNREFQKLSISGIKAILDEGRKRGEFREVNSEKVGYIMDSLLRSFHYLHYLGLETYPPEDVIEPLCDLLISGLEVR